ncbi:unnamed protein product [Nesidiocoris tenuis]|uniref:Uncharacterized protein n=1 Tax=Nesidiocoris tenuis TaxID=355587 RepID=A0A6H5GK13_9HEMI|nr:unnamed protein product [Nesidiocoris tenuis]
MNKIWNFPRFQETSRNQGRHEKKTLDYRWFPLGEMILICVRRFSIVAARALEYPLPLAALLVAFRDGCHSVFLHQLVLLRAGKRKGTATRVLKRPEQRKQTAGTDRHVASKTGNSRASFMGHLRSEKNCKKIPTWAFLKRAISEFLVEWCLVDLLGHATAPLSGTQHARRARCEKENGNCGTQLTGDAIATAWSAHRRLKLPVEKVPIVECFGPTVAAPSRCGLIRSELSSGAPRIVQSKTDTLPYG